MNNIILNQFFKTIYYMPQNFYCLIFVNFAIFVQNLSQISILTKFSNYIGIILSLKSVVDL